MIVTGMGGAEIEGQLGANGFVLDFRVESGQMLLLEQGIEEEEAADDASALDDQVVGAFGRLQSVKVEGRLVGGEGPAQMNLRMDDERTIATPAARCVWVDESTPLPSHTISVLDFLT